jgi:hypothetical protein
MFFTPLGVQQSTDLPLARYKAARFPSDAIADLCCGIGGDLLALGEERLTVGVERDLHVALIASANCRALAQRYEKAPIVVADVGQFDMRHFAAWHMDPDRRASGRRHTRVESYEPGIDVMDRLLNENPHGAIKLAPAAEIPEHWSSRTEQEWISRDGECKQLVAWFGDLAKAPGARRATALSARGEVLGSVDGSQCELPTLASRVGKYLYEPDAAVLAAELVGRIAEQHALNPLIPGGGYLTSEAHIDEPLLTRFRVEAALPYRTSNVKPLLAERSIGQLEVKKRGVDLDPEKIRRDLRLPGSERATLLLTRLASQVIAILAHRE